MRILLVEPDEYYHSQLAEGLGDLGELIFASHPRQGRLEIEKSAPDAIITELLLPSSSGYQFLEELHKSLPAHKLPVIIFSAVNHLEDIKHCLNYGITGYFVKGQNTVNDIRRLLLNLNPNF